MTNDELRKKAINATPITIPNGILLTVDVEQIGDIAEQLEDIAKMPLTEPKRLEAIQLAGKLIIKACELCDVCCRMRGDD
jgi:hypothetical protein